MLTLLNHQKQRGVSARQLHVALGPLSGFYHWFSFYKKIFKEGEQVFLLLPFLKCASGRHTSCTGDYLLTIPVADYIISRSRSQLAEKVREKLYELAGQTPPAQEHVTVSILDEKPVISLSTSLRDTMAD